MRKNNIKILATMFTVAITLFGFAACKNSSLDYNRDVEKMQDDADKAIVSFRVNEKSLGRSTITANDLMQDDVVTVALKVERYNDDDPTTLVQMNGGKDITYGPSADGKMNAIQTFEANQLLLNPGKYKFTLALYATDDKDAAHGERVEYVVQTGELDNITIHSGENDPLVFNTKYSKPNGDLSVTFEFDFADMIIGSADDEAAVKDKIGGYNVKAGLFRSIGEEGVENPLSAKNEATGQSISFDFESLEIDGDDIKITKDEKGNNVWSASVLYTKNDVPNGNWYICFEVYEGEELRNTYVDLVKVKSYKTTGECKLSNINTVYGVTYDLNGGEWVEEYLAPDSHSPNQGIYLPGPDDIKRNGYDFVGWLDEDLYNEDPDNYKLGTTDIYAGKEYARDYNLKAQWVFNFELFVSESGDDGNDGLSLDTAFASLQKASDYIKDYERNENDCIKDFEYDYRSGQKGWMIYIDGHLTGANAITTFGTDIKESNADCIDIYGWNYNKANDVDIEDYNYPDVLDGDSNSKLNQYRGTVLTINTSGIAVKLHKIKITNGIPKAFASSDGEANGGGIYVGGTSELHIKEGVYIADNWAKYGGGIYIDGYASVYMYDGMIADNYAYEGSEVYHNGLSFGLCGYARIPGSDTGDGTVFLNNSFDSEGNLTNIGGKYRTIKVFSVIDSELVNNSDIIVAKIKTNKYIAGMPLVEGALGHTLSSTEAGKFRMKESGYLLEYSDDVGKLKAGSIGGNVTTSDGVINIYASIMGDKLYVNSGSIVLTAFTQDGTQLPEDADITWSAKLLYGGVDVNDFSEADKPFYDLHVKDSQYAPPAYISITNVLETAGNYQLYVTASYKMDEYSPEITSSQTFNFNFGSYLISADCTDGFKELLQLSISAALDYSVPLDIVVQGNGTVSEDEDEDTLAIVRTLLSDLETDVSLDLRFVEGIETIPEGAFVGLECLKSIKLPFSTKTIESGAFMVENRYHSPIKYISFPDTVENIGPHALPDYNQIKKFEIIPYSTEAESPVFSTVEDGLVLLKRTSEPGDPLTQEIVCVASDYKTDLQYLNFSTQEELSHVTAIPDYAFAGCESLESVTLGSVTTIGIYAFSGCTELTDVEFIANGIEIEKDAFAGCSELTSIVLTDNSIIHGKAFEYSGITQVTISAGVEFPDSVDSDGNKVSNNAFMGCSDLTTVTIAAGFDSELTATVFERCENITSFEIDETHGSYDDEQTLKYSTLENGALLVKSDFVANENTLVVAANAADFESLDFASDENQNDLGITLSDINKIGPLAFALDPNSEDHPNVKLKSITSFGNVTEIGESAFAYSTIETIGAFNDGLAIKDYAFAYSNLTTIPAFKEDMSFYNYIFWYSKVTTFEFESDDIHVYGNPAFATLDEDDEDVDFYNTNITLILDFDVDANNISKLKANYSNLNGEQTERCILLGLDDGRSKVTQLVLNGKVTLPDIAYEQIDNRPFAFGAICRYLEKITFAGTGSTIGAYQFYAFEDPYDTTSFKNLEVLDLTGVTRIGNNAFEGTQVGLRGTLDLKNVEVIGKQAFKSSAISNAQIKLPTSSIAIGYSAFLVRGYNWNPKFGMTDFESWSVWTDDNIGEWYKTTDESIWNSWIENKPTEISDSQGTKITSKYDIEEIIAPDLNSQTEQTNVYLYKLAN